MSRTITVDMLRDKYPKLMRLPRNKIQSLQEKAVWLNYVDGTGRILGEYPRYYERINYRGESVQIETYFHYINRVH